jgi:LPS sulfotransferase NodH
MGIFWAKRQAAPPAGWLPPKMTYAIASHARSGSNLLSSALKETKVLGRPTEYFNRYMIEHGSFEGADGTVEKQCQLIRNSATEPGGVCGMKLFPRQLDWAAQHVNLPEWFPNMTWVWLRRRDILGQAISWEFASQSQAWTHIEKANQQPVYDFNEISRRLVIVSVSDARWNHYFAARCITPMEVWFEDLPHGGLEQVIGHLAQKANVVPAKDWKAQNKMERQSDPAKDEWRERFLADCKSDLHPLMQPKLSPSFKLLSRWLRSKLTVEDFMNPAQAKSITTQA